MTFSIIGGDLRQIALALKLKEDGYDVRIFGFDKELEINGLQKAKDISEAASVDIVILPLPVSSDQTTVNAPFSDSEIQLDSLIKNLNEKATVFGGKIPKSMCGACEEKGIGVFDYFDREELSIANAIPTAEGAIEIALSEMPYTLHKSPCLVIGYGRIGKILADRLKAFGADVTVSARKYSDFAWIEANGYKKANSLKLEEIGKYRVIFNTVPAMILTRKELEKIPEESLIIDLASKPGGVDFALAKELGVKVIWALSLPGKTAPITSGEIIKETILNILREKEGL